MFNNFGDSVHISDNLASTAVQYIGRARMSLGLYNPYQNSSFLSHTFKFTPVLPGYFTPCPQGVITEYEVGFSLLRKDMAQSS